LTGNERISELRETAVYQAAQLQAMRDTVQAALSTTGEESEGHRRWVRNALAEGWLQTLTTLEEATIWSNCGG
jgi:hypothetical protein